MAGVPGPAFRGSERLSASSLCCEDSRKRSDLRPVSELAACGHHVGFLSPHVDSQAALKEEGRAHAETTQTGSSPTAGPPLFESHDPPTLSLPVAQFV
ncbi:Hypothetical predicted protein [Xyrichtys novacula]|uniref:Uncharacterized protein n=1 Tax=Xyrichtys novacula TaxID=13765 RepID=A0AAV1GXI2_XYRNO|nr:Hypothetical predicted protein [Xyrichtys novacula]